MRRVTAREANQRFSEVLSAVETGEQVVITLPRAVKAAEAEEAAKPRKRRKPAKSIE